MWLQLQGLFGTLPGPRSADNGWNNQFVTVQVDVRDIRDSLVLLPGGQGLGAWIEFTLNPQDNEHDWAAFAPMGVDNLNVPVQGSTTGGTFSLFNGNVVGGRFVDVGLGTFLNNPLTGSTISAVGFDILNPDAQAPVAGHPGGPGGAVVVAHATGLNSNWQGLGGTAGNPRPNRILTAVRFLEYADGTPALTGQSIPPQITGNIDILVGVMVSGGGTNAQLSVRTVNEGHHTIRTLMRDQSIMAIRGPSGVSFSINGNPRHFQGTLILPTIEIMENFPHNMEDRHAIDGDDRRRTVRIVAPYGYHWNVGIPFSLRLESLNGAIGSIGSPASTSAPVATRVDTTVDGREILEVAFTLSNRSPGLAGQQRALLGLQGLIPIRFISYMLGAEVDWNNETGEVSLTLNGDALTFAIGEKVEGMDAPAQIINDRTFVPLRFISEYFGATVWFDGDTREIEIIK